MRRGQFRTGKEFARSIIIKPLLACLETRDNRVAGSGIVFRCMLTWRIVTAADVTTLGASAEMQPPTAGRQTFCTTSTTRLGRGIYAHYLRPHVTLGHVFRCLSRWNQHLPRQSLQD